MEHIKIEIKGNINKYSYLEAEQGFCFYDIDEEKKQYITSISTPILDETELTRKYIVVFGNAEKLNKEIEEKEIENADK
jgi:alpha-galactosidase/6-phospho-beta-glucosidase family protein